MTNDIRRSPIRHLTLSLSLSLSLAACGGELPFPGLNTQEIYALGVQAAQQEEWEEAVESFEYVLFSPGFSRAIEARFRLAGAQYEMERYIESRSEFQRVIERAPADTLAVRAALGVCRSLAALSPITQRDQSFTRQARLSCRQVAADFAGTVIGLDASRLSEAMTIKLAEQDYDTGLHYVKRGLIESGLLYFEDVATQYPETEWAPWALYQMVEIFDRRGYLRGLETTRRLLLEAYPDSEPARLLENGKP